MTRIYIAMLAMTLQLLGTVRSELGRRRRSERGAINLEYVVIALGLLLAAGAVVAVVTGAVDTRLNRIN